MEMETKSEKKEVGVLRTTVGMVVLFCLTVLLSLLIQVTNVGQLQGIVVDKFEKNGIQYIIVEEIETGEKITLQNANAFWWRKFEKEVEKYEEENEVGNYVNIKYYYWNQPLFKQDWPNMISSNSFPLRRK